MKHAANYPEDQRLKDAEALATKFGGREVDGGIIFDQISDVAAHPPADAAPVDAKPFGMYIEREDGTSEFQRAGKAFKGTAHGYKVWTLYAAQPSTAQGNALNQLCKTFGIAVADGFTPEMAIACRLKDLQDALAQRTTSQPDSERDAARYRWLRDIQCNSLSVSRNDGHACNYMTAKDWIEEHAEDFADVAPAELQAMKDTNTIWDVQIYPDTPIGFNLYRGAMLDSAIDAAMAAQQGEKD